MIPSAVQGADWYLRGMLLTGLLASLLTQSAPLPAQADAPARPSAPSVSATATRMTFVPEGAAARLPRAQPQRAVLVAAAPAALRKAPEGLAAPLYGTLDLAGGCLFVLDEPAGGQARLWVDTNRNGDLTDDAPAAWTADPAPTPGGPAPRHSGWFKVNIGTAEEPRIANVMAQRSNPSDPDQQGTRSFLMFWRDYLSEGTCMVGDRAFAAVLADEQTRGHFGGPGLVLYLDLNANGVLDPSVEGFAVGRPFSANGQGWEVRQVARDGSSFELVRSTKPVPQPAANQSLSLGGQAISFEATDTDGKRVRFPEDYAGKVVLLDFWATWCSPCMAEVPNIVVAHEKFHAKGFEVLGISLDSAKTLPKLPEVLRRSHMTWRQVADGNGWQAAVALKYGVRSIPAAYLVDGSTGRILGVKLRGQELQRAVERALAQMAPAAQGSTTAPAEPADGLKP